LLFREELQFLFDQSYYIISRMLKKEIEKNDDTFLYVRRRVTQNFYETWFTIFQQASTFMIPVLLVLCTLHRILTFGNLEKRAIEFDFTSTIQKLRDSQAADLNYDLF